MFFAVAVVPAASASFGFGSAQINNTSKSSLLLRLVEWLDGGQIRRTFSMLIILSARSVSLGTPYLLQNTYPKVKNPKHLVEWSPLLDTT
jgi:hypothetical protein